MSPNELLGLCVLVFTAAVLYSMVGHAGASGYLAAMALFGVAPAVMKPTALALNVLVALVTTTQFARAGHFSWRVFWPFALGSIPFAFLGGALGLPADVYKRVLGAVLVFAAYRLLRGARAPETVPPGDVPRPVAIVCGAG